MTAGRERSAAFSLPQASGARFCSFQPSVWRTMTFVPRRCGSWLASTTSAPLESISAHRHVGRACRFCQPDGLPIGPGAGWAVTGRSPTSGRRTRPPRARRQAYPPSHCHRDGRPYPGCPGTSRPRDVGLAADESDLAGGRIVRRFGFVAGLQRTWRFLPS